METWRLRTPNDWEALAGWTSVLVWRNHVYNTVIHSFKGLSEVNPVLHQLGYRDKAWSVNRCAPPSPCQLHACTSEQGAWQRWFLH